MKQWLLVATAEKTTVSSGCSKAKLAAWFRNTQNISDSYWKINNMEHQCLNTILVLHRTHTQNMKLQVLWLLGLTSSSKTWSILNYSLLATLVRPVFQNCTLSVGADCAPYTPAQMWLSPAKYCFMVKKNHSNKQEEQKLNNIIHHSKITLLTLSGSPSRFFFHCQPHTSHF